MALSDPITLSGPDAKKFISDLEAPRPDPARDAIIREAERIFGRA